MNSFDFSFSPFLISLSLSGRTRTPTLMRFGSASEMCGANAFAIVTPQRALFSIVAR